MASTYITIRIEEDLKTDLQKLLKELGLDMTTFFTMCASQAVREQALPFHPSIFGKDYDRLAYEFKKKREESKNNDSNDDEEETSKNKINLDDLSFEELYKLTHQKK